MRLYVSDVLPTTPDLLTIDDWRKITIDKELRLSLGIIGLLDVPLNQFQVAVWALENDNPVHPNQQRVVPFPQANLGGSPSYHINYRNVLYVPGTAPSQEWKTVRISGLFPIFVSISIQDLEDILLKTVPGTDTSVLITTEDYYNHIIRDGGAGPQVRELLIDGRDLTF